MNTSRVTTSSGNGASPRRLWTKVAGYPVLAFVAAYLLLVLATEAPAVLVLLIVVAVLTVDVWLLMAESRRSSRVAVWCGSLAVLSAVTQAAWVYTAFVWDALPAFGYGLAWWGCGLTLALVIGLGLLVRRESRPLGWAVLMGSMQGCVASVVVLLAAFAAAMGAD
jgi:hypothetical protein